MRRSLLSITRRVHNSHVPAAKKARWHRTGSPEFERMNANGLLGIHGDDLRLAAEMESVGEWADDTTHLAADHELRSPGKPCARCSRALEPADATRRRADGTWVHQTC